MRHTAHRRSVGARAQDPQIAIDLLAVGVDDGAAERRRQFERQRRFAAGRRPGDDDDRLVLW